MNGVGRNVRKAEMELEKEENEKSRADTAGKQKTRQTEEKTEKIERIDNTEPDNGEADLRERRRRMLLSLVEEKTYVPMKLKELAALLNVTKEHRDELRDAVDSLVAEGRLSISKRGRIGRPETFAVQGIFQGHPRGFGFVAIEGRERDVFIPADKTGGAMHGDKVLASIREAEGDRRAEGEVLRVLEHANETLVGLYEKRKGFGFVVPDNPRITSDVFIPQGCDRGAVTGHKVVVRLKDFGTAHGKKPEGEIEEILGHLHDPGVDILSVVRAYGLPEEFPPEVLREAEQAPEAVTSGTLETELAAGRLDLRGLQTVTIDGEEAKDLDDAVTVERIDGGGYRLGVHIADVSHYVTEGSALDREAFRRGTSVYLADRVIPMLPHRLSNGICSLNQGEDRLALSCIMEIDQKGTVIGHQIAETVIRVDRRMTYTAVNEVLETMLDRPDLPAEERGIQPAYSERAENASEYAAFIPLFLLMKELADLLRKKRRSRGSIDFDFPETKLVLDEKGRPIEVKPYERNAATRIIEDFMLLANETVAEDYFWQDIPFLYRTHDKPDEEKMRRLGTFINNFGYTLRMPGGEVHPKEVQKLLDKAEGTPEEALIGRLTLRSMKQAKYTTQNTGHFGLAASYYTHFTSPIRRYPDLQIHRIIKENLHGGLDEGRRAHYGRLLPEAAVQSSALERRADEAERETEKLKKVQYMERFLGQEFDGVISGVTAWGFYVELPNTVEGLVRVNELRDDYFIFDESHYQLIGELTRKTYKLGQPVRVMLASCDRFTRTVEFVVSGSQP